MKEENNTDGLYYLKIDARHYFPDGKIARDVLEALRCRQYAEVLAFYLELFSYTHLTLPTILLV